MIGALPSTIGSTMDNSLSCLPLAEDLGAAGTDVRKGSTGKKEKGKKEDK